MFSKFPFSVNCNDEKCNFRKRKKTFVRFARKAEKEESFPFDDAFKVEIDCERNCKPVVKKKLLKDVHVKTTYVLSNAPKFQKL